MNTTPPTKTGSGRTRIKYRIHWHILLIHFPISAFLGAFVFMMLHVFTRNSCYTRAAYISLVAGALVMIPTTATGWFTWKGRYNGVKGKLFVNKIRIAFSMVAVSVLLVIYQTLVPFSSLEIGSNLWHLLYLTGVILLMLGAIGEGYYGGRLHHR